MLHSLGLNLISQVLAEERFGEGACGHFRIIV